MNHCLKLDLIIYATHRLIFSFVQQRFTMFLSVTFLSCSR